MSSWWVTGILGGGVFSNLRLNAWHAARDTQKWYLSVVVGGVVSGWTWCDWLVIGDELNISIHLASLLIKRYYQGGGRHWKQLANEQLCVTTRWCNKTFFATQLVVQNGASLLTLKTFKRVQPGFIVWWWNPHLQVVDLVKGTAAMETLKQRWRGNLGTQWEEMRQKSRDVY